MWPFKNKSAANIQNAAMDPSTLAKMLAGGGASSISPDRAMQAAAVNTCVRILSESVATLPCTLYRKTEGGGREKATDHTLYDLLAHRPNSWQTAYEFWEYQVRSVLLRGNGYAVKTMVGRQLRELIPLHPDIVTPEQNDNFSLEYRWKNKGEVKTLTQGQIFHIRDASDNGFIGISRVRQAARAINIYIEAEKVGENTLRQGLLTKGMLESPNVFTPEQKQQLAKSFNGDYGGADNAGKTPLLEGGLKYNTIQMSFEDAQFLETRRFQKTDIFGLFRVPPHMAQDYEKTTSWGTGMEQISLQFVMFSLMPIIRRIEAVAESGLLTRTERKTFEIKFNVNSLLRGDLKTRAEFYSKGLLMGWFSINDVRRLENMPPVEAGDTHRAPTNTDDIMKMFMDGEGGKTLAGKDAPKPANQYSDVMTVNEKRKIDGLPAIVGGDAIYMPSTQIPAIEIEE